MKELSVIYDLAVKGGSFLTLDDQEAIVNDGLMLVRSGIIDYLGPISEAPVYKAHKTINAHKLHVLPAFFNQHTHLSLSLYSGLGTDLKLHDWLKHVIWPLESAFCEPDNVYLGSVLSLIEMIKSGTGSVADMDFHSLAVGRAVEESGLRAFLGEGLFDEKTPSAASAGQAFEYTSELINKYSGNELISVCITPHATFSCSPGVFTRSAELAQKWDVPVCSHVSETRLEVEQIRERYKMSPVEYLQKTGVFEGRFIAIHGVHLDAHDMEILADNNVAVIHNPHSNMVLGSGLCQVPELISKGVKVGIGTDSAASNNHLSMLSELQTAYLIHKGANHNPTLLPAGRIIGMATKSGYEIYGMEKLGQLGRGYKADFMIIDLNSIHNQPLIDPYSSIVSSSYNSDIQTLVVNGRLIMEDRKILTLDEDTIIKEARKFGAKVGGLFPDLVYGLKKGGPR